MGIVYEIMHKDRRVTRIDTNGRCRIFFSSFMPYNLYLEENEDYLLCVIPLKRIKG